MKKHHAENERIKRRYFDYLKQAKGQSEHTVDAAAKAIARFEEYTNWRDFKAFHYQQAIAFKAALAGQRAYHSGDKLSKATLYATLASLKRFFQWLSDKPGYKSRLQYSQADYFSLSDKDTRVATARREQKAPTIEQVRHVISIMPTDTDLERRNQALVAFTLLTGARVSAIASIKLKHVDILAGSVFQDAREVQTKFSKTFTTYFFPVGDDIHQIVRDWVLYLRNVKLFGNDDPLFPATQILFNQHSRQLEVSGLSSKSWGSTGPVNVIFKEAFEAAGLPYFNPHSFRDTLVQLGETLCQTPEEFKAWSQNLGHEKVLTTFYSYGGVAPSRQGVIIHNLAHKAVPSNDGLDVDALATALASKLLNQRHTSGAQ